MAVSPAPLPAFSDLLAAWPGPALHVDAASRVLGANGAGSALLEADGSWLEMVQRWVALGASRPHTHSVPVATGAGSAVIEWTLAAMPAQGTQAGYALLLGRDATLERQMRQALSESRQRYKDLVEVSSDFAWETSADGRFVFVSPGGALGYRADELVGRNHRELILPELSDDQVPFTAPRPVTRTEVWLRAADGSPACLVTSAVPLTGSDGAWRGARGACRDITEARLRGMELAQARLRERYLNFILQSTRDDVDPTKTLEIAAGVVVNATGADGARILAGAGAGATVMTTHGSVPDQLAELAEPLVTSLDGEVTSRAQTSGGWRLMAAATLYRREVNGAVLAWRPAEGADWVEADLAMLQAVADHVGVALAQADYQDRLRTLSERDGLTGLYNRRTFMELLEARLAEERRSSALLFFDLDNFKAVNDVLGHAAGDDVLRAVGQLLGRVARKIDLTARLGGDEFVLWLREVDEEAALTVADRLLAEGAEFLRPHSASAEKPLGFSIGVALRKARSHENADGLVARGDAGMYAAKRMGKGHRALSPAEGELETAAGKATENPR